MEHRDEAKGAVPQSGTAPPDVQDVARLQAEAEELRARAERLLANWQRAQADLSNYRRQVEREREDLTRLANALLVANLLPVVDDLERALDNVSDKLAGFTWVDGIWFIYRKFLALLEAHGLQAVKAEPGQPFDPQEHQAVSEVEGEEGKVVAVVQRGYRFQGRLIRPALVTVGKPKAASEPAKPPPGETAAPPKEPAPQPGQ